MRRLPAIVFLVAVLGAAVYSLLQWERSTTPAVDLWKAVPSTAAVIIELPELDERWPRWSQTSLFWQSLQQDPACHALDSLLGAVATAVDEAPGLRTMLHATPPKIVLLRQGGEAFTTLVLAPYPRSGAERLLGSLGLAANDIRILAKGETLTHDLGTLGTLHFKVAGDLLMIGTSMDALEEADMQRTAPSPHTDPLRNKAQATWGQGADAHVLVHTGRATRLLGRWLLPEALEELTAIEGWLALDLRTRPEQVLLSGALFPEDSAAVARSAEGGNGLSSMVRVLPSGTSLLRVHTVGDPERYLTGRATKAPPELRKALFGWVRDGIALAGSHDALGHHHWAVLLCDDPAEADRRLTGLCPEEAPCDTAHHRGIRMQRLPRGGLYEDLLGSAFAVLQRPWYALLGDRVVLAPDTLDLGMAVDAWMDGHTLAEDPRAGRALAQLGSTMATLWWLDVAKGKSLIGERLRTEARAGIDSRQGIWSDLGALAVQVSPTHRGDPIVTITLDVAPMDQPRTSVLWTTPPGEAITGGPWLVKDHSSGAQNILVQRADHAITLYNGSGKELWRRSLDGPVLGDIAQVDRYRNGKLQLFFNTAGKVHQIDRLGRDVEGFPVVLKQQAAVPMSVVDYDNKRDYRALIPDVEGGSMNIGVDGAVVKGWDPERTGVLVAPLEHIRIKGKDYLIGVNSSGKVLALDRRGASRYTPTLQLPAGTRPASLVPGMAIGTTRILWTDSAHRILSGTLDGAVDTLAGPGQGQVRLFDLDQDGNEEVLRTTTNGIQAWQGGKLLFEQVTGPASILLRPVAVAGDRVLIPVADPGSGRIHLFGGGGLAVEGSPFTGHDRCALGDVNLDGALDLVATTAQGVVVLQSLGAPVKAP